MSSLEQKYTYILTQDKDIKLSGNPIQTEKFFIQNTLRDGGKIRFKIRYSAELQGFCLLEVFLLKAQNRTQTASMTIPNGGSTATVQEQEQEFGIWEPGDYYFFFKMSSNNGIFFIEDYQLYWSAS
ncbi:MULTISPECIES: hypothetical protein [unclassified Nostoc]|uniref:hypothetical protein n=1 Tax=unclassified Nostoc TaxID=2593658 RepID=UPI000DED0A4E|nr:MULTISPECIES: hypothetical protein [unclassified Nostoc]MBD2509993.1 hypothetical protein [Desmonostoc muscorum FACHB-395]QHG15471.1 hypothetical protein GJB62_05470 [Nostoc sp. ATCC 53789]QLE47786.1 hypothetical protein FD724_06475 [Nostoc sp. C057]RCJ16388.1 hypothetical protein A6V25_08565 [Nostoc sp. ATCC 53789]